MKIRAEPFSYKFLVVSKKDELSRRHASIMGTVTFIGWLETVFYGFGI